MKKKLSILMAVIMALTMLTACAVGGVESGEKTKYYWLTDMTQYRDGSGNVNREQISADDPRVAVAFTYEEIAPYIIVNENFEASLTLPDEMWIDNEGVRTVCIMKVVEDSLGINYEIYECENDTKELEILICDAEMNQYAHLYGTAGNQIPVVDGTTPDDGSSGQTPAPAPEPAPAPTPEPTYAYPFMGKYYVGTSAIYFDETYVYFTSDYSDPTTYTIKDLGGGNYFLDLGGDGLTYIAADDMFFLSSQGFDCGDAYRSDKATFEAFTY